MLKCESEAVGPVIRGSSVLCAGSWADCSPSTPSPSHLAVVSEPAFAFGRAGGCLMGMQAIVAKSLSLFLILKGRWFLKL